MLATLEFIGMVLVMWGLAYYCLKPFIWTAIFAVVLFISTSFGFIPWYVLTPIWLIFICTAVIFNSALIRRRVFMQYVYDIFSKILPPISQTEQDALDSGDAYWEGELFHGRPNWKDLLGMEKPTLTSEEQAFIDNQVEHLCGLLDDWQIVHKDADLSPQAWDYIKKERFFGLCIDKKYGGLGFSALAHSSIVIKIATRSCSAAVDVMVPNSLGPGELIAHYGTEEQKDYYLPRLAQGKEVPCFALTGPKAGSDAGAMTDYGVVCKGMYEGKEITGIRLTWNKRYITLAPIATVLGLAFKLYDPDQLIGDKKDIGITLALLPTSHPGVEVGRRHLPLNMAFMNGPTEGQDVFIPLDWVIGGPEKVGEGWRMLMDCLSIGRSISLPALSTAISTMSYRLTGAYARIRNQFNVPIGYFEGVEAELAKIGGYAYMVEATRLLTVSAVDKGLKPAVASAIAKYHMTEMSRVIMTAAMDIHAGKAIQLGPLNYLGNGYQANPISITVEGANILTRNLIIFGQGAMRCHPFVYDEIAAVANPDKKQGLKRFDKLIVSHTGFAISNVARSLFYGLTGGRFIRGGDSPVTNKYFKQLTRMSSAFAMVTDFSMLILGGNLKRKERVSARLGDIVSHLYMASATLKYYHENGENEDEQDVLNWCVSMNLYKTQEAFDAFFENFPNRWVAACLKRLIFPFGRAFKSMPSDRLDHKIAQQMLNPTEFRARLTTLQYVSRDSDDGVNIMETAFSKVLAAEDAYRKVKKALKQGTIPSYSDFDSQVQMAVDKAVITKAEKSLVLDAEHHRLRAIAVDDFDSSELTRHTAATEKPNIASAETM